LHNISHRHHIHKPVNNLYAKLAVSVRYRGDNTLYLVWWLHSLAVLSCWGQSDQAWEVFDK